MFDKVIERPGPVFECYLSGEPEPIFVPDDLENRHRQAINEWVAAGGVIEPYVAPPAPPPPPVVLSADVLFFERMTDDEYDDLDASIRAGETARVYRGWAAATSFEEGTAMWALLVKHLDAIGTTEARRGELLARPITNAAMADDAVPA